MRVEKSVILPAVMVLIMTLFAVSMFTLPSVASQGTTQPLSASVGAASDSSTTSTLTATASSTTTFTTTSTTTTSTSSSNKSSCQGWSSGRGVTMGPPFGMGANPFRGFFGMSQVTLTVGQTIKFTDPSGRFFSATNRSITGNASGSFVFTVTSVFKSGYTLTLTSGLITIGSQKFTVTGGSAQIGPFARELVGQGAAGSSVQFLFQGQVNAKSNTVSGGAATLDLKNGSNEYLVMLRPASS